MKIQMGKASLFLFLLLGCTLYATQTTDVPKVVEEKNQIQIAIFTPPPGWKTVDPSVYKEKKTVKAFIVGKGSSILPPSLVLTMQPWQGTLKEYINDEVKDYNDKKGLEWKDLGQIKTASGPASLSQVDSQSTLGEIRRMDIILLKNRTIYILTATALKKEFDQFYKEFFNSMKSLKIISNAYELINDPKERKELIESSNQLINQWREIIDQKAKEDPSKNPMEIKKEVFESDSFQNAIWHPYEKMIDEKYQSQGPEWKSLLLQNTKDQLFTHR